METNTTQPAPVSAEDPKEARARARSEAVFARRYERVCDQLLQMTSAHDDACETCRGYLYTPVSQSIFASRCAIGRALIDAWWSLSDPGRIVTMLFREIRLLARDERADDPDAGGPRGGPAS